MHSLPKKELREAFAKHLPALLQEYIPTLIYLVEKVEEKKAGINVARYIQETSPGFEKTIETLAGKDITVNGTIISFGSGNQIGDIHIRDIAGRDIVHNNYYQIIKQLNIYTNGTQNRATSKSSKKSKTTIYKNINKSFIQKTFLHVWKWKISYLTAILGAILGWYIGGVVADWQALYPYEAEYLTHQLLGVVFGIGLSLFFSVKQANKKRRSSMRRGKR